MEVEGATLVSWERELGISARYLTNVRVPRRWACTCCAKLAGSRVQPASSGTDCWTRLAGSPWIVSTWIGLDKESCNG